MPLLSVACLLPVANRYDLRVYASGDVDEEDLCVEVRGAVVGGQAGYYRQGSYEFGNSLLHEGTT